MPFTPLHIGPGLAAKAAAPRRFSVTVFGLTQVAIDIEVLWHVFRGDRPLHQFWHTYAGALLLAGALTLVGKPVSQWIKGAWNLLVAGGPLARLQANQRTTWAAALSGALMGAVSHIALDSLYHTDIAPFAPWSLANPFSRTIDLGALDRACIALGIAGAVGLLARRLKHRQRA